MNKYNKMREGKKTVFAESGTPKMVSGVKKAYLVNGKYYRGVNGLQTRGYDVNKSLTVNVEVHNTLVY